MRPASDRTIIYCTANIEDKKFESKIIKNLLKNSGDLPIISISQKPIKLGRNIVVHEFSACYSNYLKQLLKGLLAAKTTYAIVATSDYLYPPEYFTYTPPSNYMAYQYGNVWALGNKYWKYRSSEFAQMVNREFWIKCIRKVLEGHKGWKPIEVSPVFEIVNTYVWTSDNPALRIITPSSNNKFGSVDRHTFPKKNLPLWGLADDLKTKMAV